MVVFISLSSAPYKPPWEKQLLTLSPCRGSNGLHPLLDVATTASTPRQMEVKTYRITPRKICTGEFWTGFQIRRSQHEVRPPCKVDFTCPPLNSLSARAANEIPNSHFKLYPVLG